MPRKVSQPIAAARRAFWTVYALGILTGSLVTLSLLRTIDLVWLQLFIKSL